MRTLDFLNSLPTDEVVSYLTAETINLLNRDEIGKTMTIQEIEENSLSKYKEEISEGEIDTLIFVWKFLKETLEQDKEKGKTTTVEEFMQNIFEKLEIKEEQEKLETTELEEMEEE